jgi:hypothetical protein
MAKGQAKATVLASRGQRKEERPEAIVTAKGGWGPPGKVGVGGRTDGNGGPGVERAGERANESPAGGGARPRGRPGLRVFLARTH